MPILVLVDTSFSMNKTIPKTPFNNEPVSRISVAQRCLEILFEFLQANNPFEMTTLILFSRVCIVESDFTRDYAYLSSRIKNIHTLDKTNLMQALTKADEMILANYNSELNYNVLVITDGIGLPGSAMLGRRNSASGDDLGDLDTFSPKAKYKIHFFCLTSSDDSLFRNSLPFYKEILMKNCQKNKPNTIELNVPNEAGQICVWDSSISAKVMEELFLKLCTEHLKAYSGKLICGHISGLISLYPNFPMDKIPYDISRDNLETIRICGFLNSDEMSDPPVFSRHYVMPVSEKNMDELKSFISFINFKSDLRDEEIMSMYGEDSIQPSFPVLLHGSFKIANMVALCEIGSSRQWYGILHSVSTTNDKKKSNLMLYTFEPGLNSVPWIPNIRRLTLSPAINETLTTPTRYKKSQNHFVWLQQQSIHNDVQKILRFTRKLPDKYDQLMAEINRIHRTAIAFQFFELIRVLIHLFENDVKMLPNNDNPEVINQIDQILKYLKQPPQQIVNPPK